MSRCRTVAVASGKGSPGVSFVASALACRLAALGVESLLVDADAEDQCLARMLRVEGEAGGGPLERAAALGALTPDGLRSAATGVSRRLWLLEARSGAPAPDGRVLVAAAREAGFGAIVADLGHQPGPLQRQLMAAADWLLWVVAPDRLGLARGDAAIGRAEMASGSAGLVVNRRGRDALAGAERALSERRGLPVMARLPERPRAAAALSHRRPAHTQRAFGGPIDGLARALHPDLAGGSRSLWP